MAQTVTLESLNVMPLDAFVAALGDIFEHSPWVAQRAALQRPFATVADLHNAMCTVTTVASEQEKLTLLRAHPELGGKVARAGAMAEASRQEQGALGLDKLSAEEFARFEKLNAAYQTRFGVPFIVCVRRHTRDSILDRFAKRLVNTRAQEIEQALAEIGNIARLRIVDRVEGPGAPRVNGRLSTHVLDTVTGKPAPGIKLVLYEIGASATAVLRETVTNSDGRTDEPLMSNAPLRIGRYRLDFHVGSYFAASNFSVSDPPYLDVIPICFAIAEAEGHYHVPLLVSPWSYSTYRGS